MGLYLEVAAPTAAVVTRTDSLVQVMDFRSLSPAEAAQAAAPARASAPKAEPKAAAPYTCGVCSKVSPLQVRASSTLNIGRTSKVPQFDILPLTVIQEEEFDDGPRAHPQRRSTV